MNSRKIRSLLRSPAFAVVLVAVFAGTAIATDANSGFSATPLARGTISGPVQFNVGEVKFQTKADVDVVTATVTIAPGGSSGWHTHPGIVLVTVKLGGGSVTLYHGSCSPTVHEPGSVFIETAEGGPGLARNEGSTNAVLYVTYLVPTGAAVRINQENPGCPQN